MSTINKYIILIFVFGITIAINACSDDPAGTDNSESVIQGSLESSSSEQPQKLQSNLTNVEGVTVAAARVNSDGSVQAITGTETETNASGEFTLHVDVETAQHITVLAETESGQWTGFLSKKVENGQTFTLKPIDAASTIETEIFTRLVASGHADIVHKADIESVISADNAAVISGNSSAINAYASALTNAAQARAEFIAETAEGNADEVMNQIVDLTAEAQFQFESSLATATSSEQRESAFEVFTESIVDAYADAGLDVSSAAKTFEMWGRTFANSASSVSSEIKNDTRTALSTMTAIAVDKAVQAEAEAAGMSETTIQSIVDAGVQLKADIQASGGAESEVETAFENYHEEVRNAMESDASVEATVIVSIDSEINAAGGFKSVFNTAIAGTLTSSLIIDAYTTFFSSIQSSVENHMESANETQIQAVSQLMILINLAA